MRSRRRDSEGGRPGCRSVGSPPQAQHAKRDTPNPQAAFSTRTCRVNPLSVPPPGFGLFTRRPNQCDHLLPDRRGQSRQAAITACKSASTVPDSVPPVLETPVFPDDFAVVSSPASATDTLATLRKPSDLAPERTSRVGPHLGLLSGLRVIEEVGAMDAAVRPSRRLTFGGLPDSLNPHSSAPPWTER